MRTFRKWLLGNSLWMAGLGLMLASSGLDGSYMAEWMPDGWKWLGLVLNTTSDLSSMTIMYWFGRLQQSGKVRRRLSYGLLMSEVVAVVYSWFFSWRWLRMALISLEPADWSWVSVVSAGYIPLMLAFIGYAQSLLAGKLAVEQKTGDKEQHHIPSPRYVCDTCGYIARSQQALNAHQRVHSNGSGK